MQEPLSLQSLPPGQARLCLQVQKFWEDKLQYTPKRGRKLLLALSGGADSTALALILKILSPRMQLELFAVTINHGLREEAEQDVFFVHNLCKKLEIPLSCRKCDVPTLAQQSKLGVEEAARILRYQIFAEERERYDAEYIVLAHNADDLCEDVLMRFTRGTGWPGLGGMTGHDRRRCILRPLLNTSRQEIERFLSSLNQQWQNDSTNNDLTFTRNRFRHVILPIFRKENPKIQKTVSNLWGAARMDEDFWSQYLQEILQKTPWTSIHEPKSTTLILPKRLLANQHQAVILRLLKMALDKLQAHVNSEILYKVAQTWHKNIGGKKFELPSQVQIELKHGSIICRRDLS